MITSNVFVYNGGNKFQFILILPEELNSTVFEIVIKISSLNSFSNLFSSL